MDMDDQEYMQASAKNWELLVDLYHLLMESMDHFQFPTNPRFHTLADWGYRQSLITETELAQIKSHPNHIF